eukprot:5596721-Amphidinium_carterae.1
MLTPRRDCNMPVPVPTGAAFQLAPLTSVAAGTWLLSLLRRQLGPRPGDLTTHGCRATVLSWCAKFGVPDGQRRLLAYHVTQGDRSMA